MGWIEVSHMTTSKENRKHPRKEANWFVTIETSGASRVGETKDISRGGAFIYCDRPLESEQLFKMVISAPGMRNSITAEARVVWSTPNGMGVRFHSVSST